MAEKGGIRTHGTVTRTTVFETAPSQMGIGGKVNCRWCSPRNQSSGRFSELPFGTFLNKSSPRNHLQTDVLSPLERCSLLQKNASYQAASNCLWS